MAHVIEVYIDKSMDLTFSVYTAQTNVLNRNFFFCLASKQKKKLAKKFQINYKIFYLYATLNNSIFRTLQAASPAKFLASDDAYIKTIDVFPRP